MRRIIQKLSSFLSRRHSIIVGAIIGGVILGGILYSIHLGDALRYYDERQYSTLAQNLATLHKFSLDGEKPSAFWPPGYPLFLSFFVFCGAKIASLRMLNFLLLGFCIYLVHQILSRQSTPQAAVLGVLLVAIYPVVFYAAGTLYTQTFAALLFLLILFLSSSKALSTGKLLLCGFLFGFLILTIPVFILILLIAAAWSWLTNDFIRPQRFLITIAAALVVVGLWSARNYVVFDKFVFISTNSGINLLLGNSENTRPNAGLNVDISKYLDEARTLHLDEAGGDAYYKSKAVEWVMDHKTEAIKLYCLKVLNYFNYRNDLYTETEESSAKDFVMLLTYGPLLLLFAGRILLMGSIKLKSNEVFYILIYISSAFIYAIFFTRIRFRLPFDYLMIMVVAMFLGKLMVRMAQDDDSH